MACGCKDIVKGDSDETFVVLSGSDFVFYEVALIVVTVGLFAFAVFGLRKYRTQL